MARSVGRAGVELAVEERGDGPAVLLVHGIADDARGWLPVADELAPVARAIAYDRRGYGASGAPEPYVGTTVEEQAEDAVRVIDALTAAPAVLCGRDLGALVCLDLAKRHAGLVRGVVVIDVPLFAFVPEATEVLAGQRVRLEEALRAGGPRAAVAEYLAGEPADRVARAQDAALAFFADYAGLASWPVGRRDLKALAPPLVIADGAGAPPHVRAAGDALARLAPHGRREPEAGTGPAKLVRELLATLG